MIDLTDSARDFLQQKEVDSVTVKMIKSGGG